LVIGVHGETEKLVVNVREGVHAEMQERVSASLRVMRVFSGLPGVQRVCMCFCDSTVVSRIVLFDSR